MRKKRKLMKKKRPKIFKRHRLEYNFMPKKNANEFIVFILGIVGFIALIIGIQKVQATIDTTSIALLVMGFILIIIAYFISKK